MSVDVHLLPQSKVELEITVEPADMEGALNKAYRRLVQQVAIPGFRKGKAPRAMVERAVGQNAMVQEAVEIAIGEAYEQAITSHHLQPITQPEINPADGEQGASPDLTRPIRFKAVVVVQPVVTLGDYHSIQVQPPSTDIEPEEIDRVLNRLQEDRAPWQAVDDTPALDGNQVTLALKATIGEESLIDQESFEYVVRDDEAPGAPIPQLSEHLRGCSVGQTIEYQVVLPEDYRPQEYVGQTMNVAITVHNIERKSLPELDDDFARSIGEYESLDAVREAIKASIAAQKGREVMDAYVSSVIDQVVGLAQVEIPDVLIEQEQDRMVAEMRAEVEQGRRMTLEQYLRILGRSMDDLRTEMRGAAEQRVRSNLVLDEIGQQDGIQPPDQEVESELLGMASLPTLKNRDKRRLMTSAEVRERVATRLRRRYVILHLLQLALPRPAARRPTGEALGLGGTQTTEENRDADPSQEQAGEGASETAEGQSGGQLEASSLEPPVSVTLHTESSQEHSVTPGSSAEAMTDDVEMPLETAGRASAVGALEAEAQQEPVTGEES